MPKLAKILFVFITMMSFQAIADWQVETFTHSATHTTSQSATVRNEAGFELAIFKTDEGTIWMDFSLSDNNFDELAQRPLPRFQIDDKKPVQMLRGFVATIVPANEGINAVIIDDSGAITTDKNFNLDHIVAERLPERVICPIFQGKERPHLKTLESLSSGKKIYFDYTLINGKKGNTSFTLKGAKKALSTTVL